MTQLTSDDNRSASVNDFFNEQWKLYQKILNNNYMGHHEIYQVLQKFLVEYLQKPFSMLELGCGDASFTVQALLNTNITEYKGIDLSETALEIAKSNMAIISCQKTFIKEDFSKIVDELVQNQEDNFDVIMTSFALHHLSFEQKNWIFGQVFQLLNPGGVVVIIDIVRREEETRESYIKRYLENVLQHWTLLSTKEFLMVEEHISTSDFPETQANLYELAQKQNFTRFERLYYDPLETTQLLCFYR